jgi:hypothetical protein
MIDEQRALVQIKSSTGKDDLAAYTADFEKT